VGERDSVAVGAILVSKVVGRAGMVVLTVGRQAAKLNNKSTDKHFALIGVSSIQGMYDYRKMYGEQATVQSTILQKAGRLKRDRF
jgi:hypothetical protein